MKKILQRAKERKWEIMFFSTLFAIFIFGGFLRFWQLENVPPGVWYDEAYNGLDAIKAYENNRYELFYPENFGREGLYINTIALSYKLFGVNSFALRFPSAVFGLLGIIGFYFLIKELRFSRPSVLIGTLMMTLSFWHINFSRIAFRGIMVPMLLAWSLFFFFKGYYTKTHSKNKSPNYLALFYFSLSGFLVGLGLHTYIAWRMVPIIFVIIAVLFAIVKKDFIKKFWRPTVVFLVIAFIAALPLLNYFYGHMDQFVGRTNAVSIFNNPEMGFWQSFGTSLSFHLGSFFLAGDPNQRHNHSTFALIPMVWAILFGFGFFLTLKEIFQTIWGKFRKTKSARLFAAAVVAQATFWVMLIPGVLSIEGIPHALRIIGAIPAIFLISIFSIEYFLKTYQNLKNSSRRSFKPIRWGVLRGSFYGIMIITVLAGLSQAYLYFEVWSKSTETAKSFEKDRADLGKTVASLKLKQQNYIIISPEENISQDRKGIGAKTVLFTGYPEIKSYLFFKPFEGLASVSCNESSQIVFQIADEWLLEQFQQKCPSLKLQKITPPNGMYSYWGMK